VCGDESRARFLGGPPQQCGGPTRPGGEIPPGHPTDEPPSRARKSLVTRLASSFGKAHVARAADPLAIHGDQPTPGATRLGTPGRPGAAGAVQLFTVQALQRPAHGRLTRRAPDTEGRKNLIRRIDGPLADRGERSASRHHCTYRKCQNCGDLVPDAPGLTRVRHRVECSSTPRSTRWWSTTSMR